MVRGDHIKMNAREFFLARIGSIMEKFGDENEKALIIFKGFPDYCYHYLSKNFSALGLDNCFNENGYIDVLKMEGRKGELIQNFFQQQKITWAFYEELILLTESINEIKEIYSGKLIVITNNVYKNYYPIGLNNNISKRYIALMDEDTIEDDEVNILMRFYCDCVEIDEDIYGFSFINKHIEEGIEEIQFIPCNTDIHLNKDLEQYTSIHIKDKKYFKCINNILEDNFQDPLCLIVDNQLEKDSLTSMIFLLNNIDIPCNIVKIDKFNELIQNESEKYVHILEKHWHSRNFRNILFYKNPDISADTIQISQGDIISDVIQQCKSALLDENEYSDIFITAPTGAGKSLLFHIPAIELMENYNAVTIVITPLKALMVDQVEQLINERHVSGVTYINSDITPQEKEKRIDQIKNGELSIIYLSPELFLANNLESIIGDRKIGLLVVDEAHLVTTWGRDFRADYWFLGGYVEKIRKRKRFPILCLTATAVYMGTEDMVNDTIMSMNLYRPKSYLGNVRRENIFFNIKNIIRKDIQGGFEDFKINKAKYALEELLQRDSKVICYCPYTSQVEDIYNSLEDKYKKRTGRYYGSYDKFSKLEAQEKFKSGEFTAMICTKAFGMGVDIPDIENIYHFAPTGNLADYVQEIGRAARDANNKGYAISDYTTSDLKYVRMLYGLSGIRQYQLKEMLRKLYVLYKKKGNRNMLISPEIFSYLFNENDIENKVKSGLLLLSKDLEQKYAFNVINVRPKSMFTKNFVNVPKEIEKEFIILYDRFIKPIEDDKPRIIPNGGKKSSDTKVLNLGKIYEVNMATLWEENFNELTFAQFKRHFFQGDLFDFGNENKLSARLKLTISFYDEFEEVKEKLENNINRLVKIFSQLKRRGNIFTKSDFREAYKEVFQGELRSKEIPNILLDLFVADVSKNIGFNRNSDKFKFIQERKAHNKDELVYRVMNSSFIGLKSYVMRQFMQCKIISDNKYTTYIPISNNNKPSLIYIAIILELFNLASYEVIGGKNTEIFIRINDPAKLRRLSYGKYNNTILTDIDRKRKRSQEILSNFMQAKISNDERWNVIEHYFLGKEEVVDLILKGKLAEA